MHMRPEDEVSDPLRRKETQRDIATAVGPNLQSGRLDFCERDVERDRHGNADAQDEAAVEEVRVAEVAEAFGCADVEPDFERGFGTEGADEG